MAVGTLHPDVGSVIELGGQDAKIIMFREGVPTGDKRATSSMNDKCDSGPGATMDKCLIKVGMANDDVAALRFDHNRIDQQTAARK